MDVIVCAFSFRGADHSLIAISKDAVAPLLGDLGQSRSWPQVADIKSENKILLYFQGSHPRSHRFQGGKRATTMTEEGHYLLFDGSKDQDEITYRLYQGSPDLDGPAECVQSFSVPGPAWQHFAPWLERDRVARSCGDTQEADPVQLAVWRVMDSDKAEAELTRLKNTTPHIRSMIELLLRLPISDLVFEPRTWQIDLEKARRVWRSIFLPQADYVSNLSPRDLVSSEPAEKKEESGDVVAAARIARVAGLTSSKSTAKYEPDMFTPNPTANRSNGNAGDEATRWWQNSQQRTTHLVKSDRPNLAGEPLSARGMGISLPVSPIEPEDAQEDMPTRGQKRARYDSGAAEALCKQRP